MAGTVWGGVLGITLIVSLLIVFIKYHKPLVGFVKKFEKKTPSKKKSSRR